MPSRAVAVVVVRKVVTSLSRMRLSGALWAKDAPKAKASISKTTEIRKLYATLNGPHVAKAVPQGGLHEQKS